MPRGFYSVDFYKVKVVLDDDDGDLDKNRIKLLQSIKDSSLQQIPETTPPLLAFAFNHGVEGAVGPCTLCTSDFPRLAYGFEHTILGGGPNITTFPSVHFHPYLDTGDRYDLPQCPLFPVRYLGLHTPRSAEEEDIVYEETQQADGWQGPEGCEEYKYMLWLRQAKTSPSAVSGLRRWYVSLIHRTALYQYSSQLTLLPTIRYQKTMERGRQRNSFSSLVIRI